MRIARCNCGGSGQVGQAVNAFSFPPAVICQRCALIGMSFKRPIDAVRWWNKAVKRSRHVRRPSR